MCPDYMGHEISLHLLVKIQLGSRSSHKKLQTVEGATRDGTSRYVPASNGQRNACSLQTSKK